MSRNAKAIICKLTNLKKVFDLIKLKIQKGGQIL